MRLTGVRWGEKNEFHDLVVNLYFLGGSQYVAIRLAMKEHERYILTSMKHYSENPCCMCNGVALYRCNLNLGCQKMAVVAAPEAATA